MRPVAAMLALALGGCTIGQKVSVQPMPAPRRITTTATKDEAVTAAVNACLAAGWPLGGSDRVVGVVQTGWKTTVQADPYPILCAGPSDSRRLMLTLAVQGSDIVITPRAEFCERADCRAVNTISGDEVHLLNAIESSLARELAGKAPVVVEPGMRVVVENARGVFYGGVVVSALPSMLVIDDGVARYEIPAQEIKSVRVIVPK